MKPGFLHRAEVTPLPKEGPRPRIRERRRLRSRPHRVPAQVARVVRKRSGGRCEVRDLLVAVECAGRGEHLHHVRRRSQGGTDTAENLIYVCFGHHAWIHANPNKAAALGLLARTGGARG